MGPYSNEIAFKGLSLKHRRFIEALGSSNSIREAGKKAGYKPSTLNAEPYRDFKKPRIQRAIELYYSDSPLAGLAKARLEDILLDDNGDITVQLRAIRMILGLSRNIKNLSGNVPDIGLESIKKVLEG